LGTLECLRDWDPAREDRQKVARRFKLKPEMNHDEVLVVGDDVISKYKMKMARSSAQYLKERDLKECLKSTSLTEDQVE